MPPIWAYPAPALRRSPDGCVGAMSSCSATFSSKQAQASVQGAVHLGVVVVGGINQSSLSGFSLYLLISASQVRLPIRLRGMW
jgi:hypothetical protein